MDSNPIIPRLPPGYLSTEVAGGFTGRVIGIGAAPGGATIARFAYAPLRHAG